jgi:hypothetical protein
MIAVLASRFVFMFEVQVRLKADTTYGTSGT